MTYLKNVTNETTQLQCSATLNLSCFNRNSVLS